MGLGFRCRRDEGVMPNSGLRVWDVGLGGVGFNVQGLGLGSGFRVQGLGFSGLRVWGPGFEV